MKIDENNLQEFIGQIIDIFEDFLDDKNIIIENIEKEDSEEPANIYGTDYGILQTDLENLISNWGLMEENHKPICPIEFINENKEE